MKIFKLVLLTAAVCLVSSFAMAQEVKLDPEWRKCETDEQCVPFSRGCCYGCDIGGSVSQKFLKEAKAAQKKHCRGIDRERDCPQVECMYSFLRPACNAQGLCDVKDQCYLKWSDYKRLGSNWTRNNCQRDERCPCGKAETERQALEDEVWRYSREQEMFLPTIPEDLLDLYLAFVVAVKEEMFDYLQYRYPIMETSGINVVDQPHQQFNGELGNRGEISIPFLKTNFDPSIMSAKPQSDKMYPKYLIRTNSTALWFFKIQDKWFLSGYLDKPIL